MKLFQKYDVLTTSYHLISSRIDLHLCDDRPTSKGLSLILSFLFLYDPIPVIDCHKQFNVYILVLLNVHAIGYYVNLIRTVQLL